MTNYTYICICEMTQQNLGEIDCIFNNNYNNKQTNEQHKKRNA